MDGKEAEIARQEKEKDRRLVRLLEALADRLDDKMTLLTHEYGANVCEFLREAAERIGGRP